MFQIRPLHDLLGENPKKIKGITITCGYQCNCAYHCSNGRKCKYRGGFNKLNNWYVGVRRFFEFKFGIKLPWPIYLQSLYTNLSGTTKCPAHKSRYYSCWDCKHTDGDPDGYCLNPKYRNATFEERKCNDPDWGDYGKCGFFEKHAWADNWDKKTGEIIYK